MFPSPQTLRPLSSLGLKTMNKYLQQCHQHLVPTLFNLSALQLILPQHANDSHLYNEEYGTDSFADILSTKCFQKVHSMRFI